MPRTQQQRRDATRRALLDATLAALVDLGYAGTTTTEVVKRAGVSQGALFRHFPTKAELLGAVIEDLYPGLVGEYVAVIGAEVRSAVDGTRPADTARRVITQLLSAMARPETRAALELIGAARTDADLAARLAPVEAAHRAALRDHAAALLPAGADRTRTDRAVDLALDLAIGMALTTAVADADRLPGELAMAGEVLAGILLPSPDRAAR